MSTAMGISGYGVSATLPDGWDGRIVLPSGGVVAFQTASFAMPAFDGEWPGGVVDQMPSGSAVCALIEQDPAFAGNGAFASTEIPTNLAASDFGWGVMPKPAPGRWGAEFTFTLPSDRTWVCWIVVDRNSGSDSERLRDLNALLASIVIGSTAS